MTTLKDKLIRAKQSVASTAADVTNAAGKVAKTTMTSITDLNGDGKIDEEDLKIALDKAKSVGGVVAEEAGEMAKTATKHPLVKDAAAGALVGGAIGTVFPIVGTTIGAAVGAAFSVLSGRNRTVVEFNTHESTPKPAPKKSPAKKPSAKKAAESKAVPAKKPAAKKAKAST